MRLINYKRKHFERSLSASQRDQLLVKEAKEDAQFRKDLTDAMRQSTETFGQSVKDVSKAMTDLGEGIDRSIEMLSRAFQQPRLPPAVNQNMFYQNPFQGPYYSANAQVSMLDVTLTKQRTGL